MWELVFLMVIMKIPVAYLCVVVWWAIKAEPRPLDGAALLAVAPAPPPRPWPFRRRGDARPPRGGPHGAPARRYARSAHGSTAGSVRAR